MAKATIQNLNEQPVNDRDNTHLVGRLLTRAALRRCLNVAWPDLEKILQSCFQAGRLVSMYADTSDNERTKYGDE